MAGIKVLSTHLVNKIAAGEIIERPASVVKELVENALDAGASKIDITVADGGTKLLAVRDDGVGMTPEDLGLAFSPHATSKIANEEDLFAIRTMGFRGEALASITAVSHAHILSRRRGSPADAGHEVRAEAGAVQPVRPAAAPEGTTVTVRDLFFNTPARRKFMRAANTEFGHVVDQLARLSLPHRQVAFTLTHNGRCTHRLPPADGVRQRVGDLFGEELAESLIEFADREAEMTIAGLLAPPSAARASARWQYFFVNGRFVRDRTLSHALREAYRGLIEPSRSPAAFVFIDLDCSEVDVNVHPAKIEVRFRNAHGMHSELLGAIRETLGKADLAPTLAIDRRPAVPADEGDDDRRRSLKQALAEFFKSQRPPQRALDFPPPSRQAPAAPGDRRRPFPAPAAPLPLVTTESRFIGIAGPGQAPSPIPPPQPDQDRPAPSALRLEAFQLHNTYIVAATDEGLTVIDQHALHERIIYEDLSARLSSGNLSAQRLLIPETVEVSESEKALLTEQADLLERLGVEVTEFGPHSVAVQKFPALLAQRSVPVGEFCRDLLDVLAGTEDAEALLDNVLSTIACKAAVKAGDPLSSGEMQALLSRRLEVERSAACPHGRPTTLTLTLGELEKQFKRT